MFDPAAMSALGLGCAQLGNLFVPISDVDASATVDAAWDAGVRYFDTAPHYGLGLAERRLGAALADRPRADFVLSTKVGRLLVADPDGAGRTDLANGFEVPADQRRVWDFSADGVRRSIAESLRRLGLDGVDVALLHDPQVSPEPLTALREGYPALHEMRESGMVGAIGIGCNHLDTLSRFVADTDLDVVMLAGRYTLLEQPALDELLPACQRRGVAVFNVGVFNSGLLAEPEPTAQAHYEYGAVPGPQLDRARRIATVCDRHGVSLPRAALAFAAAHPAVASVVVGAGRPEHARRNAELFAAAPPPVDLWRELVAEGLLRPDAPLPEDAR